MELKVKYRLRGFYIHIDTSYRGWALLHFNYLEWNGKVSVDVIQEATGNRQGGYYSADDWKLYGNPMLINLEEYCGNEDIIAGTKMNVITIADDVAPCASADTPREALHNMQLLLNIVQEQ